MANPHRGDTPVEVGGEEYVLCYDLNACASVMEHLGLSAFSQLANLSFDDISLSDIVYILWAGLQRHHSDLSRQDVGALEWDLADVMPAIGEAFNRGLVRQPPSSGAGGKGTGDRAEGNVRRTTGRSGAGKKRK